MLYAEDKRIARNILEKYTMKHIPKVLIVATSHKTRGGITAVIEAHKKEFNGRSFIVNGLKRI